MSLLQHCAAQALRGLFGVFVCMAVYGGMAGLWGVSLIAAIMAILVYYADLRFLQQDAAGNLQQNTTANPAATEQTADNTDQSLPGSK